MRLIYMQDLGEIQDEINKIRETSVAFYNYFVDNWLNCTEMWMQFYRQDLTIFATNTNNHKEAFNRRIKRSIKSHMHLSECITELIAIIFECDASQRSSILDELKTHTCVANDRIVQSFQDVLSNKAM